MSQKAIIQDGANHFINNLGYIRSISAFNVAYVSYGWLGSRVVSVLDSSAEGPGSNRSRDAVG